jgi:hypothetical protein
MTDLSCYGPDIEALADLAGDFDLRSPVDTRSWYRQTWESIAEALGFAQQLTAELARRRGAREWVTATGEAGMAAFMARMRQTRPAATDRQASTQMTVIEMMTSASRARGELWRVTVDPTTLETGACYEDDSGGLSRAFYPDTTPGYFGDGWPGPPPRAESRCGWETPLVLHFGTFPWVYSSRLDAAGPGLRWISPSLTPAIEGFRVMTSFLQPEANLQQDARQVVTIYRHFAAQTAPLVARVPGQPSGRAAVGQLYQRAGLLHVHQGSLHVAGLDGPRGRLPALAYNHIVQRFAAFFAVRRATLRALAWAPEMKRLVASTNDPCLRAQVEEVARAG